jgi:T5SS/PEP-CTERM-associated repeat protein
MKSHDDAHPIVAHLFRPERGSPTMNRITQNIARLLFLAFAIGPAASAHDYYWNDPAGGDFEDPANWNDGTDGVPAQADTAIIDVSSVPQILFWSDHTTYRFLVRSGDVRLNAYGPDAPFTYTLLNPHSNTPGLVVGHGGRDLAWLKLGAVQVHAVNVTIGHLGDATGHLRAYGEVPLTVDQYLTVGNEGIGTLEVYDATAIAGVGVIGLAANGRGEVFVDGWEAQWNCDGPLTIGMSGEGSLIITDDATVTCHDAIIAQHEDSTGAVSLDPGGTRWFINGTLDVGMTGSGRLEIECGSVVNHTFAIIGTYDSWPMGNGGVGEVSMVGASWTIDGDLYVGFFGEGTLSVGSDSEVVVAGDASIGLSNSGTLILSHGGMITIGGNLTNYDHEFDRFVIEISHGGNYPMPAIDAGGAIDSFEPEVTLDEDYEPQAGDTFAIAHADGGLAPFSFILPDLPGDLAWEVIQDEHDVSLTIVLELDGDINGDGVVDTADLLQLLAAWGECDGCPEDLDGDGSVNTADLLILLANWTT